MVSVFIDTFIVLNLTVFAILTTGVLDSGKEGDCFNTTCFYEKFWFSRGYFCGSLSLFLCLFYNIRMAFFRKSQCRIFIWKKNLEKFIHYLCLFLLL